jgi:hypothetical protein
MIFLRLGLATHLKILDRGFERARCGTQAVPPERLTEDEKGVDCLHCRRMIRRMRRARDGR